MLCYSYCTSSSFCMHFQPGVAECPYSSIQHEVKEEKCQWCNHLKITKNGETVCPIGCTEESHYIK